MTELVRGYSNAQARIPGVAYAGLSAPRGDEVRILEPRGAVRFSLAPDDLAQFAPAPAGATVVVLAFDGSGKNALSALGLEGNRVVRRDEFLSAPLRGWIEAQGGVSGKSWVGAEAGPIADPLVLKATSPVHVWAIVPLDRQAHISGRGGGTVSVSVRRGRSNAPRLPEPLGPVRDEFTVTRATAAAYPVRAGEVVQIVDVEGQQCSDFLAFRSEGLANGIEETIDGTVTRTLSRSAYPTPGLYDKFYDSRMRPLLRVVQDTVGRHDTFALACTALGYEERGFPGHVNCSDNISGVLAAYGVAPRRAWPAINFFFNTWIDRTDNQLQSDEAWSAPGDFVALRAEEDLLCVSTACPDDTTPINGWNPTDVHVRIYSPDARILRAVAWREKEDAAPAMSEESAFHARTASLSRAFRPARDLWAPSSYTATGALGEYWACRRAATLQDMSGLRKFDVKGPDAESLLQTALTRDVGKLPVYRAFYCLMCDATGSVIDDGVLVRLAPQVFRWLCGSEESARSLAELADERNLRARIEGFRGALPNLALQGPKSRDVLARIVYTSDRVPALDELRWFGMTVGRLRNRTGAPFMLTRTGFTGELGYELFMDRADAVEVWDAVLEAGEEHGVVPMGSDAQEILRIEAGLASAGAEFAPGVDALEAGLGFCVDFDKPEFRGREALRRNRQAQRNRLVGLRMRSEDVPRHGDRVYAGERPVGVVTSATRSPMLGHPIAMARVAVEHAEEGTVLAVGQLDRRMKSLDATVSTVPFVDPERKRPRA